MPDAYGVPLAAGSAVDLVAHVEESFFMGRKETRLRIVEVLAPLSVTESSKGI
jgi:hypothetical protein